MTPEEQRLHDRNVEFDRWRQDRNQELPSLANRVFALRGKRYYGVGCHYEMESDLGYVIARLNAHNGVVDWYSKEQGLIAQTVLQIRYEALLQSVVDAEASAAAGERWSDPIRSC